MFTVSVAKSCQGLFFRSLWISLLLLSAFRPLSALANNDGIADNQPATITEQKGEVLKREFRDWTRSELGDAQPTSLGDKLIEGNQLATGDKSYAQLSWTNVVTRAWANSIFAVAPNQRLVYLQSGQMIFCLDKHRKDKREYVLWSNLLQARVRGTTVLFQSDNTKSQIAVLEGCIDVLNKKDRSVVRLYPGSVYEVVDKTAAASGAKPAGEPAVSPDTAEHVTSLTSGAPIPLFETAHTRNSLYAISRGAYNQPIISAFPTPLPSAPLLHQTLSLLPTTLLEVGNVVGQVTGSVMNLLSHTVEILRLPTGIDYSIGPQIGSAIKLPPDAITFFPPTGIIGQSRQALPVSPTLSNVAPIQGSAGVLNIPTGSLTGPLQTSSLINQGSALTGAASGMVGGASVPIGGNTFGSPTSTLSATLSGTTATLGKTSGTLVNTTTSLITNTTNLVNQVLHLP